MLRLPTRPAPAHFAARVILGAALAVLGSASARADATRTTYAQMLVSDLMRRHPDLLVVAMHVTAPGASDNTIIATNLDRIGRKSDDDDLAVIRTNKPILAPMKDKGRYEVLLPLRSVTDETIGALGIVFKYSAAQSEAGFLEDATAMRNQLRAVIPTVATLFEPFTVGTGPGDTLAQRLTMQALARHPDLLVIAMHVTPPGGTTNKVIAINEPKFIGRDSDSVDTDTEKTGKIVMQVIPATHRMEVHMPMIAADGSRVGTICTVYLWEDESQAADYFVRSLAMRDELRPQIPGYESLFKP
jgi:iron complex outermembrane receptor protein